MAFVAANFSMVSSSKNSAAGVVWASKQANTIAEMLAADYFLSKTEDLTVGDTIIISASDGGAICLVTAATAATVTVAVYV